MNMKKVIILILFSILLVGCKVEKLNYNEKVEILENNKFHFQEEQTDNQTLVMLNSILMATAATDGKLIYVKVKRIVSYYNEETTETVIFVEFSKNRQAKKILPYIESKNIISDDMYVVSYGKYIILTDNIKNFDLLGLVYNK